jgi:signal transduction histidine kinase
VLSVFHSAAFRLALFFAALFAVGAITLVFVVDVAVSRYAEQVTTDTLVTEATRLQSEDRREGRRAVVDAISAAKGDAHEFRYLLIDRAGSRIAGDLPLAPAGWGKVTVAERATPGDPPDAAAETRTYGITLADKSRLVVGSNSYDVAELRDWLDTVALWSGMGITLLALGAGYLIAAIFVRRLDRVNAAANVVMTGHLSERLPAMGLGPEFDRLSANLNRMLARIEALVTGMRQVSTDIAHDLRTPLTRLRQRLEAARASSSLEAHRHAIDDATDQVDEVLGMFRALLRIGTLEAGIGSDRFKHVYLSDVLERVALAYQPAIEDQSKGLCLSIEPCITVEGDAELLAQMFNNLVENALVHTPAHSVITIGLRRELDAVVAVIADNGPGIPMADRAKVLQRFYRLERSRALPGSGLGLSLAAAIAHLHNAQLSIADNDPGVAVSIRFGAGSGRLFNASAMMDPFESACRV